MSLFRKIFGGSSNEPSDDENKSEYNDAPSSFSQLPVDEKFTYNFKKNGGKFIYCENLEEAKDQFLNILEENDWFECEALCFESHLFPMLEENKLEYKNVKEPKFFFATCENLIADEGSVFLSSNQLKQFKPNELPTNMIIFAKTSQILESKGDGLRAIKKKYDRDYPSNITTIKYFEKSNDEDFLQYGSAHKNLYLLLLEDL